MPAAQLKSLADKYGVSLDVAEGFWAKAKEQYGEDWPKVTGTVKVMLKNYKKSKNESYIQKALNTLTECDACGCKGDKKKCKCDGNCKCGDKCKCKKKMEEACDDHHVLIRNRKSGEKKVFTGSLNDVPKGWTVIKQVR